MNRIVHTFAHAQTFIELYYTIFSPIQVASLRMLIASSFFLPFFFRSWKLIENKSDLLYLSIVGLCGSFIPAFLFTYAETDINSGLAGMLNSFTPIFTVLLGLLFFSKQSGMKEIIGISLGSVGVVFLTFYSQQKVVDGAFFSILLVILATLCYAVSLSIIKYKLSHLSSLAITSISLTIIWFGALFISIFNQSIDVIQENPYASEGFTYIFILAFFSTAVATILFNYLIKISSAVFASSVTYLMPVVALFWGMLYDETIHLMQIAAMSIILLGVFIINFDFKKSR